MRKWTARLFAGCALLALGGCAGTGGERAAAPGKDAAVDQAKKGETAVESPAVDLETRPKGTLNATLKTVVDTPLDGRIDLLSLEGGATRSIEVKKGSSTSPVPQGDYRAYVHVYDNGVPVLVQVQDLTVKAGQTAALSLNLLEGASGAVPVRAFDSDGDLAIDRVELECGTDPYNAASIPGRAELPMDRRVLRAEGQWYRGDLHAYSKYGVGTESVSEIVGRAEKAGLDFLAICDRNTLASTKDPGFKSDKLALIPAMEWGSDGMGVALIYGPRTTPDPPSGLPAAQAAWAAQAECIRVQAQGGIWAIAHPTFPTKPWQWGISYVNAVEVWFRDWRGNPPLALNNLGEDVKIRKDGRLVHSIAAAASAAAEAGAIEENMSANAQACLFWDYELKRGLMGCAIAGSGSGNKKVPLAKPVTYICAKDLSVPGLLEGLRLGRTYISCDPNGPKLAFNADVMNDNSVDVGIGGVVPLNVDVTFVAAVQNAVGKKLQVLENGRPIRTVPINADDIAIRFTRHPSIYSAYRIRVIGPADPKKNGFGPIEVYALSSPIYAQDITQELLWRNPNLDPKKTWVKLQTKEVPVEVDVSGSVPPTQIPGQ
jgi:hypothetical protein